MTDQELKDLVASTAKTVDELSVKMKRTDERFSELAKKYGGLSDNLGAAAEEFFYNSLRDAPVVGGIRYNEVIPKVYGGKIGKQTEYDMVLINGAAVAIIEVKHKVHPSSLEQLEAQLASYKTHFPEFQNYALYGGIAGFSIPDEVVAQAKEKGMFVLKCKGELLEADTQSMRAF